jgi:hypothetical protein
MPRPYGLILGEGTSKIQRGLGFVAASDYSSNDWYPDLESPNWGVEGPIGTTTPINTTISDNLTALGLQKPKISWWVPALIVGGIALLVFRRT